MAGKASSPEDSVFAMLQYQYSNVKSEENRVAVVIFNFTSAHAVEDFEFDWQKRIRKIINKYKLIFLFSTEKQFYYKYLMWTVMMIIKPVSTF